MRTPSIVIIGRPNVGKSSLFNRLFGRKRALVHNMPGVTRDCLIEPVEWWVKAQRYDLNVIDTGGLGKGIFEKEIAEQVDIALGQADLAILVLDGQSGLVPQDESVIRLMRERGLIGKLPVIPVINKVDSYQHEDLVGDFYQSGFYEFQTISAEHNRGIDDLKELIVDKLTQAQKIIPTPVLSEGTDLPDVTDVDRDREPNSDNNLHEENSDGTFVTLRLHESTNGPSDESSGGSKLSPNGSSTEPDGTKRLQRLHREKNISETKTPKIAIVGKPNVGKSTLTNALIGKKRMVTSNVAGTTVDSIDTDIELDGRKYTLIDTAGVRKKQKTQQGVEVLSVIQTKKALERAQIAFLVIDGEHGVGDQDEKIGGLIQDAGCAVVIIVNKWDTQRKNPDFNQKEAAEQLRAKMRYLNYAPVIFTSALYGRGLKKIADLVDEILHQRSCKVLTNEFTEWVRKEAEIHNPQNAKFFLSHQASRNPPTFVCHVNNPKKIHFSLSRHLVNGIRAKWGYMGSPVRIKFVEHTSKFHK